MTPYVIVGIGGALGAMARYGFGVAVARLWPMSFPLGTLLVNIIGSLLMGLLVGSLARSTPAWQEGARLFLAVGILGGFTTFSSFSLDAIALIERGEIMPALGYVLVSVAVGIVALYAGIVMTRGVAA